MKNNLAEIIEEISLVLEQMGLGNYNVSIVKNYVGEYVQIKDSLIQIIEEMRSAVKTIKQVADEVDSGSVQLAAAAEDLAVACTGQATQVSDLMIC